MGNEGEGVRCYWGEGKEKARYRWLGGFVDDGSGERDLVVLGLGCGGR